MNPVTLEIPVAPHGLNKIIRMNWVRRHKETKRWRKLVWIARCQVLIGRPTPAQYSKVTIERASPKLLDEDNLYGSVKMVLDALKCNELIVDDSPKHLAPLKVTQRIGKAHLRILVEEAVPEIQGSKCSSLSTLAPCTSKPPGTSTSSVGGP